jgi:hypothetical protein
VVDDGLCRSSSTPFTICSWLVVLSTSFSSCGFSLFTRQL